jgi:predicted transcriptional regulator
LSINRKRSTGYTTIENECLLDARLSPEAIGVLCYMRLAPDETNPQQLAVRFRCGRDRIYRILNELIDTGYLKRNRQRGPDGTMGLVEYVVGAAQ